MCKINSRGLSSVLCDAQVGGRLKKEGLRVSVWLTHVVLQQRLTQHCKAIIFQFKGKKKGSGLCCQGWTRSGAEFLRGGPVGRWPLRSAQGQLMETDWICMIRDTVSILVVQTAGCPWLFLRKAFRGW